MASNLQFLHDDVRQAFSDYAEKKRDRYLTLGDLSALDFLDVLLASLSRTGKNAALDSRIFLLGGAFFERAKQRGLIRGNGTLAVSTALIPVLFRYRWRLLASLPPRFGFTATENRILYDFEVRFLEPTKTERRLNAVKKLTELSPDYAAVIAEARVLYEAGRTSDALIILQKAAEKEGETQTIERFVKALR
jgi:hypothetical protein